MLPSIRPSSKLIKKSPDFNLKEIFENNRKINLAEHNKGNIKKLKAVVHIRQGDTAVVETPWNTFIRVWLRMVNTRHQEYLDISDIKDNKIIAVHEFYQFSTKILKLTSTLMVLHWHFIYLKKMQKN